ncbi:MAG: bifunctional phosphopantothenoylcysteine decarboxylase/phosphopantothenate--cysteine ligase CoaBC [Candidatus Roizmanbacteria bacterium]|nr:bifunctional phosphopantothenoylcysteine decarboxylase/phosphopantothenate--cysteine ligase CoaBC [Candidatus Roizmanbacteria bacterium]
MSILKNKTIVLGVTGSIAAYKALDIARRLITSGTHVNVVMTKGATKLISPLTFQAITHHPVTTDLFNPHAQTGIDHISLAKQADAFLIAPATANILAKLAHGISDDALTTTFLATRAPVIGAPAMETRMWEHPATQHNVRMLTKWRATVIAPEAGRLASGAIGIGRLADPADIVDTIRYVLGKRGPLRGKRMLITAGPTREYIDPIRFFSNASSGSMGYALAREARDQGATVTLVTGPTSLGKPAGITTIPVTSAQEMHTAVFDHIERMDAVIATAAVTDYRPKTALKQKIKKTKDSLTFKMVQNPDILTHIKTWKEKQKRNTLFVMGFAAETDNLIINAQKKLKEKNLDMIVANPAPESFGGTSIKATVLRTDQKPEKLPVLGKSELAEKIISIIMKHTL